MIQKEMMSLHNVYIHLQIKLINEQRLTKEEMLLCDQLSIAFQTESRLLEYVLRKQLEDELNEDHGRDTSEGFNPTGNGK